MMRVVLRSRSGTAGANLERAKDELNRVLSFRGNITGAELNGARVIVRFEINPKWDLTPREKVKYLKEWIPAKTRNTFRVLSVSEENRN